MNTKRSHMFWMLIGCTVPLLFIFLAPSLGLGSDYSLLLFLLAMFAIHLLMPHGHGGHGEHNPHENEDSNPLNKKSHEPHQH